MDARNGAASFLHLNRRRVVGVLLTAAPPEVRTQLRVGLEQQAIGVRRRPAQLGEPARVVFVGLRRLRRTDRRSEAEPGTIATAVAVQTVVLRARPRVELVAW